MHETESVHMRTVNSEPKEKRKARNETWKKIWQNWELYIFIAPAFFYFLVFSYGPMYGIQIAFKNYIPSKGYFGSEWVGFDHFIRFLTRIISGICCGTRLVLACMN